MFFIFGGSLTRNENVTIEVLPGNLGHGSKFETHH